MVGELDVVGLRVWRWSTTLLHGPAVAVRIAEEDERASGEILDLAHLHPPLHELPTRGLYIRDDQLNALEGARLRLHDPRPDGDRAG
jgi:hypothetical protein